MVETFIARYGAEMLQRTLQHISKVGLALVLAASIGVSLGVVISGHERVARWVIGAASILFTVPSLALFPPLVVALAPIRQGTGLGCFIVERMGRASRSEVTGGTMAVTMLGLVVNDGLLLVEEAVTPGTRGRGERT